MYKLSERYIHVTISIVLKKRKKDKTIREIRNFDYQKITPETLISLLFVRYKESSSKASAKIGTVIITVR